MQERYRRLLSSTLVVFLMAGIGCGGSSSPSPTPTPTPTPPAITSLSPASVTAGSAAFTLTVTGTGFVSGATVQWNSSGRTTTFSSATQLTAAITAADIAAAGTAAILVANTDGTKSSASTFTINAPPPPPTITSLSPTSAIAGAAAFTLTVNGAGFVSGATVQWGGSNRTTTYMSATQLTAAITATDIASAGAASVLVANPDGTKSSASTFTINPAPPALTSLSPATTVVGSSAFTLTVNGTGFISSAVVAWNGSNRTTTYVSTTQLTAAISAADIASTGSASVDVAQGSLRSSNQLAFSITPAAAAAITTLAPASGTAGGAGFTLTVNGTGFLSDSVVRWNGSNRTTTYVSAVQLTASITAADIATAGSANVTVMHSVSKGAAVSAPVSFSIGAPAVQPVIVQLISANTTGAEGAKPSYRSMVTRDGSYVAFPSAAQDLIVGDTNNAVDVFMRSTCVTSACTPSTTLMSLDSAGAPLPYGAVSNFTSITDDGGRVAFLNTTGGVLNVRDTCVGASGACTPSTTAVSVTDGGGATVQIADEFWMTPNGRFLGFTSYDTSVVAGMTVAKQAYVRDTCRGVASGCTPTTRHVSIGNGGASTIPTNGGFIDAVGKEGRYALFHALDANIMPGQVTGGRNHLYLRDTCFGIASGCTPTTVLIDIAPDGVTEGDSPQGGSGNPASFTEDSRYVIFNSQASNLIAGQVGTQTEVYLRDTCNGAPAGCTPSTRLISTPEGGVVTSSSNFVGTRTLTPDGRFVTFVSLDPAFPAQAQIYVRDLCTGVASGCAPTTTKVSVDSNGLAGAAPGYTFPSISADGHYVVFTRSATGGYAGIPQIFLAKTGY